MIETALCKISSYLPIYCLFWKLHKSKQYGLPKSTGHNKEVNKMFILLFCKYISLRPSDLSIQIFTTCLTNKAGSDKHMTTWVLKELYLKTGVYEGATFNNNTIC